MNRNIAWGGLGGSTLLAVTASYLDWLCDPEDLSEFLAHHPKTVLAAGGLLVIALCALGSLVLIRNRKLAEAEAEIDRMNREMADTRQLIEKLKTPDLYEEGKTWRHTVLVIDDKISTLRVIRDQLQGTNFDVVYIKNIDDYRLAAEYEIIVSDIFGCGPTTTAASVLNAIKKQYPYKVVLPMSSQPAACDDLDADYDPVLKDSGYKFVSKIVSKVTAIGEELNDVNEHWSKVEKRISGNCTPKDIERIKTDYYRFVNKKQSGL